MRADFILSLITGLLVLIMWPFLGGLGGGIGGGQGLLLYHTLFPTVVLVALYWLALRKWHPTIIEAHLKRGLTQ